MSNAEVFGWKISKFIVLVFKLLFLELKFNIIKKIMGKIIKNERYPSSFFNLTLVIKIKGRQNICIIK